MFKNIRNVLNEYIKLGQGTLEKYINLIEIKKFRSISFLLHFSYHDTANRKKKRK